MVTVTKTRTTRKKSIAEIGRQVPSNLKFGIIVVIALFWAQFVKSLLNEIFSLVHIDSPVLTDLILAIAATAIAFIVLKSYQRIKTKLSNIKW